MNIIFGDVVKQLPSQYVVLELDTFIIQPINHRVTTWCVVENLPNEEVRDLALYKKMHNDAMIEYRNQNWSACLENINKLLGRWGGEADTFYQELLKRIENFKVNPPEPGWDGAVLKQVTLP
jgi:hypothetical protein